LLRSVGPWCASVLLLLISAPAAPDARAAEGLPARLAAALEARGLRGAEVAALVVDAGSGALIFEREPDRALVPASNMKILTALAAAAEFGPTYRFATEVYAGAPPDAAGVVPWLAVRGEGDPTLTSEQWWRLAADLRRLGVRSVAGEVWLDGSAFDGETWHPAWGGRSARAYHAPVAALSANYGAYAVHVEPAAPGEPARVRVDPAVPYLRLLSQARTGAPGSASSLAVDRRAGEGLEPFERVVVTGSLPAGAQPEIFWRSVLDPLAYAGSVLALQLAANEIAVAGPPRPGRVPEGAVLLHRFEGKDMGEVVRLLGKYSSNVIAESLVKAMGARASGGPGSWPSGTEALRQRLAGLGLALDGARIVDGSGLARGNRVSPRLLVQALLASHRSFQWGPELVAALPIAGGDGTLAKRAAGASGAVRAKTGLLDGVTSLSGLAELADGRLACFSILVNGFRQGAPAAQKAVDGFVEALVR
jgi:D-alanyl-D-alanine carboxypeptidase/D-alanyl-D-alanine-endopeptidase (penicillin-binding protein 4)